MKKITNWLILLLSLWLSQITFAVTATENFGTLEVAHADEISKSPASSDFAYFQETRKDREIRVALAETNESNLILSGIEIRSCKSALRSMTFRKYPLKIKEIDRGYYYELKDVKTGVKEVYVFTRAIKTKSIWRVNRVNMMLNRRIEKPVDYIGKCQHSEQGEFYIYKTPS